MLARQITLHKPFFDFYPLCFDHLTNPFLRKSPVFTSIQNPRGVTPYPRSECLRGPANSFDSYHIRVTPAVSCDYALFCATAQRQTVPHQSFAHSFYRHGGGTPLRRGGTSFGKRALQRREVRRARTYASASRLARAGRPKPAATLAVFVGDAGEAFDQDRGAFFVLSADASDGLSTIRAGSHIVDDVNRGVLAVQLHGGGFAVSHGALHLNSPNSHRGRIFSFGAGRVPSLEGNRFANGSRRAHRVANR